MLALLGINIYKLYTDIELKVLLQLLSYFIGRNNWRIDD